MSLRRLRDLSWMRNNAGELERRRRRRAYALIKKSVFNKAYSYPADNNRTRSLSKKGFAQQTRDLRRSQYLIDQHRGVFQDTNLEIKRPRLPWSDDLDILAYQARRVINQELEDKTEPLRTFFDDLVNFRNRPAQRAAEV